MRIYKRGTYYWVAWSDVDRESTKQTTRPAANAWVRQRELERVNPAHAAARAQTVGSLIGAFIADRAGLQRSPATLEYYTQKLGHVARLFGVDSPLAVFTGESVDKYIGQRRTEGAGEYTVSKEVGALRAMLKKARRWKWFATALDEVMPEELSVGYTPKRRWATPDDLDLVLEELAESRPEYAGAVAYAVASAARRVEVSRAKRGDLVAALGAGILPMHGSKTKKSASPIAVVSIFRPLLERALAWALPGDDDALAFGDWCTRRNSLRELAVACKNAGVERLSWNDLRRSHGRWLRRGGVAVELIAEQLRHANPTTTRRVYAQIEADELGPQIEAQLLSAGCPAGIGSTPIKADQPEPKTREQSRTEGGDGTRDSD